MFLEISQRGKKNHYKNMNLVSMVKMSGDGKITISNICVIQIKLVQLLKAIYWNHPFNIWIWVY